jgi:hypothetical protein
MATEVISIIDPDNGSGTDYTSLSAWEAGEQRNLVTADEIAIAKCRSTSGTADTTAVLIDGWTTDSTRYIKIWTDLTESFRHNGKWDDSKYRLIVDDAVALYNTESYVTIDGIQCRRTYTSSQYGNVVSNNVYTTAETLISNCIIDGDGNYNYGLSIGGNSGHTCYVWNTIVYNTGRIAFDVGADPVAYAYNCTAAKVSGAYNGFEYFAECKNCIAVDIDGSDFSNCTTVDYCAGDDGTGTNAQTLDSSNNYENEFVDYSNDDYHLVSGSVCVGNGTDDPGSGLYSDDIDGDSRSSTWDIGADEYVAGGTTVAQLDSSLRVFTRDDLASAHHLKSADQLASSFNVFTEKQAAGSYRVFADEDMASAFNVMAASIVDSNYRIKTVDAQASSYNIIAGQVLGSSWAVFSGKQLDSGWNVLASGYLASLASAYNVAGLKVQAFDYHVKSETDAQSGYRVFTKTQADSLWRVIRSDAMAAAYNIMTSKSMNSSAAVRAAATMLAGARILSLVDQQFAYAVGNLVAVLSSSWEVHSDIVILPLSTHAASSIVFDHKALSIAFDHRAYEILFSQEGK